MNNRIFKYLIHKFQTNLLEVKVLELNNHYENELKYEIFKLCFLYLQNKIYVNIIYYCYTLINKYFSNSWIKIIFF